MKDIILGTILIAVWVGIIVYLLPTAYADQRCNEIEFQLREKQENPELYPGFTLTEKLEEACPAIRSNLGL